MPEVIPELERFIAAWRRLRLESRKKNLNNAESFNVFKVLNIAHAETKLHTPFLVDLFNFDGLHAQGTLFVKEFLSRFIDSNQLPTYVKGEFDDSYTCREEVSDKDSGRMDIVIERLTGKHEERFCIVVENKIEATDQPSQLDRYWEQYLSRRSVPDGRRFLIYLHAKGPDHQPGSGGSVPGQALKVLTYASDITPMLSKCKQNVKATNVRETIEQYLEVVKHLGGDMSESLSDKEYELCVDPRNWIIVNDIMSKMQVVHKKVSKQFLDEIKSHLTGVSEARFRCGRSQGGDPDKSSKWVCIDIYFGEWPSSVRLQVGFEGYWYYAIEGDFADRRADIVEGKLSERQTDLGLQHWKDNKVWQYYKRHVPEHDPLNWPLIDLAGMKELAEAYSAKVKQFLGQVNPAITVR